MAMMLALGGCSLLVGLSDLGGDGGGLSDVKEGPDVMNDASDVAAPDCGHTFCESFDEDGASSFSRWPNVDTTGGTLSLSAGYSPPFALQASIPAATALDEGPTLEHALPAGSKIHVDFEMQGDCLVNQANALSIELVTPLPGMTQTSILLYESPATVHLALAYVLDGGEILDADDNPIGSTITSWRHFMLDIDFPNDSVTLTDVTGGGFAIKDKIAPSMPPGPTRLRVGVVAQSAIASDCSIWFDDIVVDVL